jgi:putative flavoprotein involved in K+ transport
VSSGDVVVVGAGPAGLAAAAQLRAAGVRPIVIDRAESIGSAWRTRYDSFALHTVRWLSALPGMPIPPAYGPWVSRDDFVRYLEDYAQRFQVEPRTGVELQSVTRSPRGWELATSYGPIEAGTLVLATGACNQAFIPAFAGADEFEPPVIHSRQYRNPLPYLGKRVLVVGSGNSAAEIATDLAGSGQVRVDLAVRTPPAILRRDTRGLPTQPIGIAIGHVPARLVDPLAATLRRLTVGDLTPYGLPAPKAPYSQFLETGTIPILDHGFVDAVRRGRITVFRGVAAFGHQDVIHDDGIRTRPDAVIAATGYRSGLEPILGPLGLLDRQNLLAAPRSTRVDGSLPGLFTVGINVVISGLLREIGRDARRVAAAVARGHAR